MEKKMIAAFIASLFVAPAFAEKPEWAGKGKPSNELKEMHNKSMRAKEELEKGQDHLIEKDESDEDELEQVTQAKEKASELKGLEKQKEKKSQQVRKELDKGSEKGQAARENSKKWWKFWGD